jgi:tight adherence protein C
MSAALGVLMLASGVAGVVFTFRIAAPYVPTHAAPAPRSMSRRRRDSLVEAAGAIAGSPEALAALAREQVVMTVVLGSLGVVGLLIAPSATTATAVVALLAVGWKLPLMRARGRERRRLSAIDIELVDALGELVMGVEAGLTLDVAMARYAEQNDRALATEFRHLLDLVQVGTARGEAMEDFTRRNPTSICRLFVSAVVQNQRLGTPLAGILRQQAATARRQRRQTVEEAAAKIPLKMIFPTVFCVLPVLMIVVVGPAIVKLSHSLP